MGKGVRNRMMRRQRLVDDEMEMQLELQDAFGLTMLMHFPTVQAGAVKDLRCEICTDYIQRNCLGQGRVGSLVLECMLEHTRSSTFYETEYGLSVKVQ